jgi:putative DNA primase/helicase
MENQAFEARVDEARRRAHGRRTEILRALGAEEKLLGKRNQPCPMCGGTDRFQYTDKYGEGNYHCRGCGAGGGFKLLQAVRQWDFVTALRRVEEIVGSIPAPPLAKGNGPTAERMKKLAKRIWDEAKPVRPGDEVDRYLRSRGLQMAAYPKVLRFHPALGYFEKTQSGKPKKVRDYPALLACIQGADGHAVTLHRTYLLDGEKALGQASRKVLSAGINGAAVRLFDPTDELALTEGIETALAVRLSTGKPVWAAISAGNLEKLWIPESVRRVCIFADNDAGSEYDGQASAYLLARRLRKQGRIGPRRSVEVFVPKAPGADWADVWAARVGHKNRAA